MLYVNLVTVSRDCCCDMTTVRVGAPAAPHAVFCTGVSTYDVVNLCKYHDMLVI